MTKGLWKQELINAFWKIHNRGEKPTPAKLNDERGRWWMANDLNGRETAVRTELMLEAGYVKTGQYGRWEKSET